MRYRSKEKESPIVDLWKAVRFCTTFCTAEKEECQRCPLIRKYPELGYYSKLKGR